MDEKRPYPQIRVRVAQSIVLVVLATFGLSLAAGPIGDLAVDVAAGRDLFEAAIVAGPLALLLALWVAGPIRAQIADQQERLVDQHERLVEALELQEFNSRLARALELADDEPGAIEVLGRSLPLAAGGNAAEILLADQGDVTLERIAGCGGDDDRGPGCQVSSTSSCPAIRYGRPLTFASGADIDACPRLQERGDDAAICAPIAVMGRPIGVVHVTTAPTDPPSASTPVNVQSLATAAGNRLGMLRALEARARQAATDPLTGLMNRRELEDRSRGLSATGERVAVAIVDLDRFKDLNDSHGHDTGDRALRAFAQVTADRLRPDDVAARYGGEEFVLLLPGVTAGGAVEILERLRGDLARIIERDGLPAFTFSAGVVDGVAPFELAALISRADEALFEAKESGRDRIIGRMAESEAEAAGDAGADRSAVAGRRLRPAAG